MILKKLKLSDLKVVKLEEHDFVDEYEEEMKKHGDIYALYFAFLKHLKKKYWTKKKMSCGARITEYRSTDGRKKTKSTTLFKLSKQFDDAKLKGYKAIKHAERFAEKNKGITVVMCDDDTHSTSKIFLIPHKNKVQYHGTRVMFIPQISDDKIMFLQPRNLDALILALQGLQKEQKRLNKNYRGGH